VHGFYVFLLGVIGALCLTALGWGLYAKIIPLTVGVAGFLFCSISLANDVFRHEDPHAQAGEHAKIHMDVGANVGELDTRTILLRAATFFGWLVGFLASMSVIGLIPTVPLFIVLYMRMEGREPWRITLPMAIFMTLFIWGLFDRLLAVPWPGSFLGDALPWLRDYVPSL